MFKYDLTRKLNPETQHLDPENEEEEEERKRPDGMQQRNLRREILR